AMGLDSASSVIVLGLAESKEVLAAAVHGAKVRVYEPLASRLAQFSAESLGIRLPFYEDAVKSLTGWDYRSSIVSIRNQFTEAHTLPDTQTAVILDSEMRYSNRHVIFQKVVDVLRDGGTLYLTAHTWRDPSNDVYAFETFARAARISFETVLRSEDLPLAF